MQAVNTHSKHTSVLTHEWFAGLPQLHAVADIARYSEVLSGLVHNVFGHGGWAGGGGVLTGRPAPTASTGGAAHTGWGR